MRVCSQCGLHLADDNPVEHCGGAPHEVQPLAVPPRIAERFSVVHPYAHGNTGTTYVADQIEGGFRGLLKIVDPALATSTQERQRLKRELRKQASLTNNSLVRIVDGGEIDGTVWLFRDEVEGESLRTRLARQGKLDVPEAVAIIAQVASGLDELHRQGLLHRDVTPGHIILTERPEGVPGVNLIDAAIAQHQPTTGVFDLVGTPRYISPEQVAGKAVSFRSDLYSMGGVLLETLTGTPPFAGEGEELLNAHKEQPPPALEGDFPPALVQLVANLLAKEPRRRPFSAQQVRRTLEPLLPEGTPPARSGSTTAVGNVPAPRPSTPPPPADLPPTPDAGREHTQEFDLEDVDPSEVEPTQVIAAASLSGEGSGEILSAEDVDDMVAEDSSDELPPGATPEDATVIRQAPAELLAAAGRNHSPSGAPPPAGSVPPPAGSVPPPTPRAGISGAPPPSDIGAQQPFQGEASSTDLAAQVPPAARLPREASSVPAEDGTVVVRMKHQERGRWMPAVAAVGIAAVAVLFFTCEDTPPATSGTDDAAAASTDDGTAEAAGAGSASPKNDAPTKDEQAAAGTAPAQDTAQPSAAGQPAGEAAPAGAAEPQTAPPAAQAEPAAPAAKHAGAARRERTAAAPRARKPKVDERVDYKELARQHYKARRYAQAADAYEKAAVKSPRDAGAFAGLGASELARGRAGAAISAYQRAVQLKPRTSGFHAALGRAYYQRGDARRARKAYEKAVELNPKNSAAKRALERL